MTDSEDDMTSTTASGTGASGASEKLLQQLASAGETCAAAGLSPALIRRFQKVILEFYRRYGRRFPWRDTTDPYRILVSEIMLQQTQTSRVEEKFPGFISRFPGIADLAAASLSEVLARWQGLGYNRRAKSLHRLAQMIVDDFGGEIPQSTEELLRLPGIGPNTAGSIAAYAFNQPAVYIETNIRALFIHVFFAGAHNVSDDDLRPLVEATLYRKEPSRWYNALMDVGVLVKKHYGNPARRSSAHSRQSAFEGSRRQIRGRIIALLLEQPGLTAVRLRRLGDFDPAVTKQVLDDLLAEGFVRREGRRYFIA